MAELRRFDGSRSCRLMTEHLVGRGPQCALRLQAGYVSAQHALIRWDGRAWEIIDRGSRNGTQLNGMSLEPGRAYRLLTDAQICFGHQDEHWTLANADEPQTMAVALDTGQALLASQGLIALPSSNNPLSTLYQDHDTTWKLERESGEVEPVGDGQIIECDGRQFRFCCPSTTSATETVSLSPKASTPTLHFAVSSDEDFVELTLEYAERKVSLGSRSHNYLLLTLARQMLADRAENLPEPSCGWMDKEVLADGFKITPQQIDGEVFRIRKHFAQHGLPESISIIERRPRTKQIRLGLGQLRIERA
jgi:FHA domain